MDENLLGPTVVPAKVDFSYIDKSEWLSSTEAAIYLRAFRKDGSPCVERVRNLVHQGRIPFYKPFGKLLFRKTELCRLIEISKKGGFKWR